MKPKSLDRLLENIKQMVVFLDDADYDLFCDEIYATYAKYNPNQCAIAPEQDETIEQPTLDKDAG